MTNSFISDAHQFENLRSLTLRVSGGDAPPLEIWDLTQLESLTFGDDVEGNVLGSVEGLGKLTGLQRLEFRNVQLVTPISSSDIDTLTSLHTLVVLGPLFGTYFPEKSVFGLQSLRVLELTGVDCVPKALETLQLEKLHFWFPGFSTNVFQRTSFLPTGLDKLVTLQELRFTECMVSNALLHHIGHLASLRVFEMECVTLNGTWNIQGNMPSGLEKISLYGCAMDDYPDMSSFTALRSLELQSNSVARLYDYDAMANGTDDVIVGLDKLCSLEELSYGYSDHDQDLVYHVHKIPFAICHLPRLRTLELSLQCKRMPLDLTRLVSLEQLTLNTESRLLHSCEEIGALTNLSSLHFIDTSLAALPDLSHLTKLTELWLHDWKLKRLPDWVGCLSNLCHLHVETSQDPVHLPESLGNLTNLRRFTLRCCSATILRLPQSLTNLSSLECLVIKARSTVLPDGIGNLTALTRLSTHCKSPTSLAESERQKLTNLRHLYLGGENACLFE